MRNLLIIAALCGAVSHVHAASPVVWDMCKSQTKDVSEQACTAIIKDTASTKSERAQAYRYRAYTYPETDDGFDKALADANAAIREEPHAQAYGVRAYVYDKKNESEKAVADATKAIEMSPRYVFALGLRANELQFKNPEAAIADFTTLIELQPNEEKWYVERAETYRNTKPPLIDKALADYRKVLELKPKDAATQTSIVLVYAQNGDRVKAEEELQKLFSFFPDGKSAYPHYQSGRMNQALKAAARAKVDFERAVAVEPEGFQGYLAQTELDKILEKEGGHSVLIDRLSAKIAADPSDPDLLIERSDMYLKIKDTANALKDADAAVKMGPKNADAYTQRGEVFQAMGNNVKARKDHTKALSIDKNAIMSSMALFELDLEAKAKKSDKKK